MEIHSIEGAAVEAVASCLPEREIDNFADCRRFFGDNTENTVRTLGILKRRLAAPGETSADLCIRAARKLFSATGAGPDEIGGVVSLTFTPAAGLPGNAFIAQEKLGIDPAAPLVDLHHACAGYPYALYIASLLAKNTRRKVLVLDGDVQSAAIDPNDRDLAPVLSDAGTATIVTPFCEGAAAKFAFRSDGSLRNVLAMATRAAPLKMDGFGVFRFVAGPVARFLKEFLSAAGPADYFAPHQANMSLVRELAKELGYQGRTAETGAIYGNSSSSTIPVALAAWGGAGETFLAGFGAGMAASAAKIRLLRPA